MTLNTTRFTWLFAAITFFLVWRITYWTPMHPDDYSFLTRGLSIDGAINFYFYWSGRLVADVLGAGVLLTQSTLFISAFNAGMFVALITLLSNIPIGNLTRAQKVSPFVFGFLFLLYWLANPALGQTGFWLIGSANYLWTNVFQLLFLTFFLKELRQPSSHPFWCALLLVLAVIAGISNENTSVTTALLVICFVVRSFYHGQRNWMLVAYVAAFVMGSIILILAPGNFARLTYFGEWDALSYPAKFALHLQRMPGAFLLYWQAIIILVGLFLLLPKKSEARVFAFYFGAASVVSVVVLAGAPNVANRSINGPLVYALVAISFLLYEWISLGGWRKRASSLGVGALLVCFSISYILIFNAYRDLALQAAYRYQVMTDAVAAGDTKIEIPAFYYSRLLKRSDRLDPYFDGKPMADHFGTSASISQYPVRSHYEVGTVPVPRE